MAGGSNGTNINRRNPVSDFGEASWPWVRGWKAHRRRRSEGWVRQARVQSCRKSGGLPERGQ